MDISVVIPAYKAEKWLSRAIESVLSQPSVDVEVIVVEDGVFDNTKSLVEHYTGVNLITLAENQGVSAARNRGLASASAEFVMFLDADDFIEGPLLFGMLAKSVETHSDIAFGPFRTDGENATYTTVQYMPELDRVDWLVARLNGDQSTKGLPSRMLWRKKTLIAVGGWREDMAKREDSELVIRCVLAGLPFTSSYAGCAIRWMQDSGGQKSKSDIDKLLPCEEIIRDQIKQWCNETQQNVQEVRVALGRFCYLRARIAFRRESLSEGRAWLYESRSLGYRWHQGSLGHRLTSRLVGLERKQRLVHWIAAARSRYLAGAS